jgi:hypothetical protein
MGVFGIFKWFPAANGGEYLGVSSGDTGLQGLFAVGFGFLRSLPMIYK